MTPKKSTGNNRRESNAERRKSTVSLGKDGGDVKQDQGPAIQGTL